MRVVTIGNFDGVHHGHRVLLDRAEARAGEADGSQVVAVTFDPHPLRLLRPEQAPELLTSVPRRAELLGQAGADEVVVLDFTPELSALSPEEFAQVLREDPRIRADVVVVGENFRFGKGAAGTAEGLRELGVQLGFEVEAVPLVTQGPGGTPPTSSSYIRERIAEGDMEAAADALSRPHRVEGVVVRGDARGRELGYPTANVEVPPGMAIPPDGVYAGWLIAGTERLPAAISVGTNPQFDGTERRVEAFALGRDDLDLYGQEVGVDFARRLRGQQVFESVAELQVQMARDVAEAQALLGG
ncbi:MAG: bifunctional riboflavin kinase/FAD synthetase [Candidatus Nanopelagicales bacterium]